MQISEKKNNNKKKKTTKNTKPNNGTCWKPAFKLPTLPISAHIAILFTMENSENNWFLKTEA